jgi:nitrogen regulatory protein P-II 1
MKRIEAIIRPEKVSEVCTALDEAGHSGVTLSQIEEQGEQKGYVNYARGVSYYLSFLNKTSLEVVVKDDDAESIIKTIRDAAFTGKAGDGNIFVFDMVDAVRIRTSENGMAAI